jgi:hypothetical protein
VDRVKGQGEGWRGEGVGGGGGGGEGGCSYLLFISSMRERMEGI